ncbi:MAG: hypothetical protein HDQ92_03500 [Desulfovibrio sp.]|nr:hypothetical protein [Desulfovibrio sp.]
MANEHHAVPPNPKSDEERIEACAEEAILITAQAHHIFSDIKENFQITTQKNVELRKKIKNGTRKTDGNGSFLL